MNYKISSSANCEHEKDILQELKQGSEEAFEKIFRQYWHPLYMAAFSRLQSHEESEEIIQGIFATLWERRESLLITNLRFYLFTAVRNRVLNQIRSRITRQKYWAFYKKFIPQQKELTEDAVLFHDLSEAVEKAVSMLPEKSRQVFTLSKLEGRTVPEIADRLQLSNKAIEYHITRSVKKLRVYLKDYMVSVGVLMCWSVDVLMWNPVPYLV